MAIVLNIFLFFLQHLGVQLQQNKYTMRCIFAPGWTKVVNIEEFIGITYTSWRCEVAAGAILDFLTFIFGGTLQKW